MDMYKMDEVLGNCKKIEDTIQPISMENDLHAGRIETLIPDGPEIFAEYEANQYIPKQY